jgi:hypothetical protein
MVSLFDSINLQNSSPSRTSSDLKVWCCVLIALRWLTHCIFK